MKLVREFRRMVAVYVLVVVYWLTPKQDYRTVVAIGEVAEAMGKEQETWG